MTDPLMIPAGKVASAYRTSQIGGAVAPVSGPSFSEMIERTALGTLETIRAGDTAVVAGLKGEMPIQQVVEATMAMETALKVTINVRDKMMDAYQEIIRMAV